MSRELKLRQREGPSGQVLATKTVSDSTSIERLLALVAQLKAPQQERKVKRLSQEERHEPNI
jgi:hypothetical protein